MSSWHCQLCPAHPWCFWSLFLLGKLWKLVDLKLPTILIGQGYISKGNVFGISKREFDFPLEIIHWRWILSDILPTMSKVVYVYCLCIISLFIVLFVDCLFICCVYCLYYSVYSVPLSGDSHYGTDAALLLSCPTSYLPLSVHWRDKIKKDRINKQK